MRKYAIVIEQGEIISRPTSPTYLDGIITGRTVEGIERNIREAIELHLEGLREDGDHSRAPYRGRLRGTARGRLRQSTASAPSGPGHPEAPLCPTTPETASAHPAT